MKKLILSLFLFCSVFAFSQGTIPIPQIIGLPAALASKVDKVTGKSLVADTSIVKLTGIQASAQVNKLEGIQKNGVDLPITGKKVNITVPTTATEIGAQPAGTYATGTGTAYNSNTGDETLTSIKTKLGAATAVSDGYLKYQDYALLHTPTTVTAANGLSISGQNISLQDASLTQSGALTFNDWNTFNSKEPAIIKNTAFNKNFGTTTGTVLEGRTFGTAANSAVGNFIQNQNSSAQSANMWINEAKFQGVGSGDATVSIISTSTNGGAYLNINSPSHNWFIRNNQSGTGDFRIGHNSDLILTLNIDKSATFSSTVNSTGFLLNGNNLTSSLTTNYIPKWNGSNFVNSLISDNDSHTVIVSPKASNSVLNLNLRPSGTYANFPQISLSNSSTGAVGSNNFFMGVGDNTVPNANTVYIASTINGIAIANSCPIGFLMSNTSLGRFQAMTINNAGALSVYSSVTAPSFIGNGSNLTGVQLPITLTTNGTSGAATFSGNVLNVPNYGNVATGGSYTASISSGSNTANPVVYSSLYTKNGTVYSSIIKGYIECTGSQGNTCTFNVSTYNGSTSNLSIIGVGAQGTNIILGSGSTGSNVVMSFTNPVGSGGIGFTLIIHYTN